MMHGRRMTLEKSARLLFGLLGFGGEIERYERMFRKQVQEGGGFAGLPGAGQHDHWPRSRGALQTGFNSARNPHMQNIRYNRIFCTTRPRPVVHGLGKFGAQQFVRDPGQRFRTAIPIEPLRAPRPQYDPAVAIAHQHLRLVEHFGLNGTMVVFTQ